MFKRTCQSNNASVFFVFLNVNAAISFIHYHYLVVHCTQTECVCHVDWVTDDGDSANAAVL